MSINTISIKFHPIFLFYITVYIYEIMNMRTIVYIDFHYYKHKHSLHILCHYCHNILTLQRCFIAGSGGCVQQRDRRHSEGGGHASDRGRRRDCEVSLRIALAAPSHFLLARIFYGLVQKK